MPFFGAAKGPTLKPGGGFPCCGKAPVVVKRKDGSLLDGGRDQLETIVSRPDWLVPLYLFFAEYEVGGPAGEGNPPEAKRTADRLQAEAAAVHAPESVLAHLVGAGGLGVVRALDGKDGTAVGHGIIGIDQKARKWGAMPETRGPPYR